MGRRRLGRTEAVRLYLEPAMLAWLDQRAAEQSRTRNDVMVELIGAAMTDAPLDLDALQAADRALETA